MDKNKRKIIGKAALIAMVVLMLLCTSVLAASISGQGVTSTLNSGETVDGFGFFAGNTVTVDGDVNGSSFVAGQDIYINGNINGDLFVAGQTITINGTVNGNVYCAGQNINYNSADSQGDVVIAGQMIGISSNAVVNRELFAAGYSLIINGSVGRDFYGAGENITIGGNVGRNVFMDANTIKLLDEGYIGGDLYYRSEVEADLGSGTIVGSTDWKQVDRTPDRQVNASAVALWSALYAIGSSLLVWVAITLWKPQIWERTSEAIFNQPLKTLGIGAIALIVTPIITILVMITILGIPLASLVGLGYGVFLYLSRLVAAVFIGKWLAKTFGWKEVHKGFWLTLLGLVLIAVLSIVPVLKTLVWLLIAFTGLGSLISASFSRNGSKGKPSAE